MVAMLVVNNYYSLSLLGAKLYFYANSAKENGIVLTTNMATLSCGWKPRIAEYIDTEIKLLLLEGNNTSDKNASTLSIP